MKLVKESLKDHLPLVVGWDQVDGGWVLECVCGWSSENCFLMEGIGVEYDDHLRVKGILLE